MSGGISITNFILLLSGHCSLYLSNNKKWLSFQLYVHREVINSVLYCVTDYY